MHVAVSGWLLALGPSGAQRRLLSLLRAIGPLLAPDEKVTLLGAPRDIAAIPGIDSHPLDIPAQPTWRRVLAERRRLSRALTELGATVLDLASLPVPPRLPCPVCLTIHDTRDLGSLRRRSSRLSGMVLRQSVTRTAHIVVPSRFTAQSLRAHLGEVTTEVSVVPGGVDEAFLGLPRQPPATPCFVHVGHLEPRKNLAILLRAFARLGDDTATLVLAGPDHGAGPALRELAAELSIADRVQFTGPVGEGQLRELYAGATAVAVPSLHEGFGLPALEALGAGAPVLVSDRGALPEVVGDAGTVLPADDPEAWEAAMRAAASRRTDGGAQRARARRFSWDAAAAQLLGVWRAIWAEVPRSGSKRRAVN